MKDLVTDAAIDAATLAYNVKTFNSEDGSTSVGFGDVGEILNAAAKFIAAEALRRASNEPLIQTLNVVDAQESWRLMLRRLSDELEGK